MLFGHLTLPPQFVILSESLPDATKIICCPPEMRPGSPFFLVSTHVWSWEAKCQISDLINLVKLISKRWWKKYLPVGVVVQDIALYCLHHFVSTFVCTERKQPLSMLNCFVNRQINESYLSILFSSVIKQYVFTHPGFVTGNESLVPCSSGFKTTSSTLV